jgi:2-polyprenyl-3-methyl-5-hydroxy-6-metoxy-1,4-benzoquinol methylase
MSPIFSKEDFETYRNAVKATLPFYERHLRNGARILNLGCGLGISSIPLSSLGYRVVGVDNDPRVVEAARQNAKTFGADCQILLGDVFDIVELFGRDSFDACESGGLLEHFDKDRVRSLVERQLSVAPWSLPACRLRRRRP